MGIKEKISKYKKEIAIGLVSTTVFAIALIGASLPNYVALEGNYTLSSETHCIDGTCTLTLYSGVRFIPFEKDKYVSIEDYQGSLKDYFNVVYLEKEEGLDIIVKDFGYNWIDLEFKVTNASYLKKMIPVKMDGVKQKDFLWNNVGDLRSHRIEINNILSRNFSLGENSTTIMLQDADSENLDDTFVNQTSPDTNYGSSDYLYVNGSMTTYIKFNISSLPSNQLITNANLTFQWAGASNAVSAYHCYNQTWTEEDITWNDQPCGWDDIKCNTTKESDETDYPENGYHTYDVTNAIKKDYLDGNPNTTIVMNSTSSAMEVYYSKEIGDVRMPYLNITYEEGGDSIPPTYSLNSTNETLVSQPCLFQLEWDDETDLTTTGGYIFSTNNSGTWTNSSWTAFTSTPENATNITTLNSTSGTVVGWKYYANDSAGNWNTSAIYTLTTGTPDIEYGLNDGISFSFECDVDSGTVNGTAYGQSSGTASLWCYNNGTARGDFVISLLEAQTSGWYMYVSNTSNLADAFLLTTSNQTLQSGISASQNVTNCAWFWATCDAGTSSGPAGLEIYAEA
jgi:hypothetical protein